MFQWLSKIFSTEQKEDLEKAEAPILITIHGYGRRRKHEFDNLALWGKKDGYEIIQFDMYDLFDENDNDWMNWISKAKEVVDTYKDSGRDIYLIGFSMGGVIASYLASTCEIKKLILLAPAFQYMNVENITGIITKSAVSLWTNEKKEEIVIPKSFYTTFTEIIKNLKKYIAYVDCPILMIHGDQDEVISVKSSINAFDKIAHLKKKLIILHNGQHRLLMDERVNWECYQIMKLFLDDKILHDTPIEQADDILEHIERLKPKEKEFNE